MSTIYDSTNGETICEGARAALATAARIASDRGEPVILEDDDGTWLVHADGLDGLAEAHRDEDAADHAASLGDDDEEELAGLELGRGA